MTAKFGIEIEFYGLGRNTRDVARALAMPGVEIHGQDYNHNTCDFWKVVTDGSVRDGAELVSPPLEFTPENIDVVRRVFAKLAERGCYVNNSCGFHVHIDGTFIRQYNQRDRDRFFQFVVEAFQAHEDVFDRLVKSHRNNNSYCKSTKGQNWRNIMGDRYHKINLDAFVRHGTIEFRHFQGTTNGDAAIAWITLCMTFMRNVRNRFDEARAQAATSQPARV